MTIERPPDLVLVSEVLGNGAALVITARAAAADRASHRAKELRDVAGRILRIAMDRRGVPFGNPLLILWRARRRNPPRGSGTPGSRNSLPG